MGPRLSILGTARVNLRRQAEKAWPALLHLTIVDEAMACFDPGVDVWQFALAGNASGNLQMDHLSKDEIGKVIRAYERRLAEHGFDVAALKSGGLGKQFVRHSIHARLFNLEGRRIVDIGCGIGMFYRFLRNAEVDVREYIGVDIVEPFLEYNRQTYPEAQFLNIDILRDPIESLKPDVVFMSQIFNARYETANNDAIARAAVERFFAIAREGVVVDFMSSYVDYREAQHHYFEPEAMLKFAKGLTRFVSLQHDYLPFEFTLALRKAPSVALPEASDVRAYD